ncbi:MAG: hypothetical protein ACLP9L_22025 [Thermoguttaceae bacterium]
MASENELAGQRDSVNRRRNTFFTPHFGCAQGRQCDSYFSMAQEWPCLPLRRENGAIAGVINPRTRCIFKTINNYFSVTKV